MREKGSSTPLGGAGAGVGATGVGGGVTAAGGYAETGGRGAAVTVAPGVRPGSRGFS